MSEPRTLCLTISSASEFGFFVREHEHLLAAFSTSADLCAWLEERCRPLDPAADLTPAWPAVVTNMKPDARRRTSFLKRVSGE